MASRERSGTCGPVPETIVSFDDEGGRSECTYRRQGDVTSCRVEQDFTCPIVGFPGQTVTSRGVITWAAGGRSASGTMSMEIRDGVTLQCLSTYDVTYMKL